MARSEAGKCEEAEARHGSDDFVAIDEAGKRKAESSEFFVVGANAAHGDESDFHDINWARVKRAAETRLITGTAKRGCVLGVHAINQQQIGMAIPPRIKAYEASSPARV